MPSYLDFNTTATFRDYLISKTLQRPDGPQTFTSGNYSVQTLPEMANVDPGDVETNRTTDLLIPQNTNVFKPEEFFIVENINTLPRSANLNLYPYFTQSDLGLIGIMATNNYDSESALMRFAANNIRNNPQGPVLSRVTQNLTAATLGRVRLMDALNGNLATASNIITGKEPLVEPNYKITVAKGMVGKAIDFVQTVAGVEFPWSEIPGDYLSNPQNPVQNRRVPRTEAGALLQDITGGIGQMFGIDRKPKLSQKPSDMMVEYMGSGQKSALYDNLSYSKYAPNYTTTARSQQSSKTFQFIEKIGQGVKTLLGVEAPRGVAYIGDDRGEDVKYTISDFNDRNVKSSYYLSLMFDPVQAELFEKQRNMSQGGNIGGKLAWISKNSRNELGAKNKEWSGESTAYMDTVSTKYGFKESSIMGTTQEILDSMPLDGAASRTHVGNVIDQTSRIFKEGESMLSRGSAIKYIDEFKGETGVEYCRVWTKDRAYNNYSDTMKRTGNIRKFDDSVMSTPWNLNIAPMSDGNKEFKGVSTNIEKQGDGFYAKKYMFSIENLAWKTSNTPGFTYNDLPYCERGNNGGRVMWFPPYDLKVSEQNNARWTDNTFLGRPEPIYTYSDTSRSGQISFKVVVDHPSILNLLVREHFNGMSDEESENYINAFFAGCHDLDFYDLIRRYTVIDSKDVELITAWLEAGKDPEEIQKYKVVTDPVIIEDQGASGGGTDTDTNQDKGGEKISSGDIVLKYDNDIPGPRLQTLTSPKKYSDMWEAFYPQKSNHVSKLDTAIGTLMSTTATTQVKKERGYIFGDPNITSYNGTTITDKLDGYFEESQTNYTNYTSKTDTLKQDLTEKKVQEIKLTIESSCSSVASGYYNEKLSLRRSHSIIQDFFNRISNGSQPSIKWINDIGANVEKNNAENDVEIVVRGKGIVIKKEYNLKDFGYDFDGKVIVDTINYGENFTGKDNIPETDCVDKHFTAVKDLAIYSPIAYFCRQSRVNFDYVKLPETISGDTTPDEVKPTPPPVTTRIEPDGTITGERTKRPNIDPMKRIIMKTLSECFYFKKLEEDSPLVFKSLKEKLKYFHPAFHSTTPEGLNARLTFLLQCIRPGDTIPVKGLTDITDLTARNTSFGPPPVCVVRIGDFYHSKIVIRDINITYDEGLWDLNPEGIGVQPMIANVSLQVNFIGGQGLSKPVERLQNALSSNFFANTEMYDERAIETNRTIGGKDTDKFKMERLKEFLSDYGKRPQPTKATDPSPNEITNGVYIGEGTTTLSYGHIIDELYENVNNYHNVYEEVYNSINQNYGNDIATMVLSPTYRTINQYDLYTQTGNSPGDTLTLHGIFKKTLELPVLVRGLKSAMVRELGNTNISEMFEFDKELNQAKQVKANELLLPYLTSFIEKELNDIVDNNVASELDDARNGILTPLDKLNYLVKYGKDGKVVGEDVKVATLSGYTYDLIFNQYTDAIQSIKKNNDKTTNLYSSTINFNNPTITNEQFVNILKVLLYDNVNDLLGVFTADQTIFPLNVVDKLKRKLNKFIEQPKEVNIKFKKLKSRKNSKPIEFTVASEDVETDATAVEETKKIFSTKVEVTDKLNFYKQQ